MESTRSEPSPSPSDPANAASAADATHRGIGSHGGRAVAHAPARTAEVGGAGAVGAAGAGVVVHRPGYRPRVLEPVPGVGVARPHGDEVALRREAAERLRVWALGSDGGLEETRDLDRLRAMASEPQTLLWVDLTDASTGLIGEVADALEIHPLVAEDIAERNQRPKLELTGDVAHIVVYALSYGERLETSEIDLVLGARYLLSSHGRRWDPMQTHHLRTGVGPVLGRGPDHLAWAVIDSLVDSYFPIFDGIDEEIDGLEDEIIAKADKSSLGRLFELKRSLIEVRHVVSPMREVFNQLTNRDLTLVQPETILYFRDVYDHLIRLNDELDSYRELASGVLDAYLSMVNNNLSLIMKRLTGVTVILAGVGAVGGLFGMSEAGGAFDGREAFGFWLVTGAVVIAAAIVAVILRRIDWI